VGLVVFDVLFLLGVVVTVFALGFFCWVFCGFWFLCVLLLELFIFFCFFGFGCVHVGFSMV